MSDQGFQCEDVTDELLLRLSLAVSAEESEDPARFHTLRLLGPEARQPLDPVIREKIAQHVRGCPTCFSRAKKFEGHICADVSLALEDQAEQN